MKRIVATGIALLSLSCVAEAHRLSGSATYYGGSDMGNMGGLEPEPIPWHDQPVSALITLPPLAAVWFIPESQ